MHKASPILCIHGILAFATAVAAQEPDTTASATSATVAAPAPSPPKAGDSAIQDPTSNQMSVSSESHSGQPESNGNASYANANNGATVTEVEKSPDTAEGATVASAAADTATSADEAYNLKIHELEQKVNDLKEKIFRSKARLILLKETVLHGSISGSKAILYHRNEMGSSFKLEQVIYSLDGKPIYKKTDNDGDLDEKEQFEIFNGSIVPGNHNLSVYMVYRGHGYGIFSYLKGYVFKLRSSFAFNAEEGRIVRIKAVGYEKGGITTDLKERPDVRFDMEILRDEPDGGNPVSTGPAAAGAKL